MFDLDQGQYLELRDRLVSCFQQMQARKAEPGALLAKLGLKLRFAGLLLRQFCQPMVPAEGA